MTSKITAIANTSANDFASDALGFAFCDFVKSAEELLGKNIAFFGSETFCPPQAFRSNFLAACRRLMASGEATAEKIVESAKDSESLLIGDVRELSVAEWIPALTLSRRPLPWIYSDWPRGFPACDPVREANRAGTLPRRLIASACIKFAYKSDPIRRDRLTPVTRAVFASEPLMERNRLSFPQLENAYVIPLPIDSGIFKFKRMTPARSRAWGWIGDVDAAPEDAMVAIRIFAFEALQNPECKFYVATDMRTSGAQKMLASIRSHPALAPRVTFLPPPKNSVELAAMLREFGVLIEPRCKKKGEFPQMVSAALSCGCFPICGRDDETKNLLEETSGMLFPAETPSSAFLLCERLQALSLEERSEMLRVYARKITENASVETVARRFSEIL